MSMKTGLALLPLLILLNAFFVAAEYSLVATRSTQVETLRAKGRRRAADALAELKENPAGALAAVQIGITMTNLLLGWIGEPAMSSLLDKVFSPLIHVLPPSLFHAISFATSLVVVTLLTVVLSELVPKALTLQHTTVVAAVVARPVLGFRRIMKPLVWAMNCSADLVMRPLGLGRIEDVEEQSMTADEIRLIATEAAADGVLTAAERALILNSLSLGKRRAHQIMVPRVHVDYLDLRRPMSENLKVIERHLHSRLPVCDGGFDNVFGVVTTKEFLWAWEGDSGQAPDSSVLQLLAQPAVFLPETLTVDKLLPAFHEHKAQMLFLVDEYGGVEGIVTLRDVVDELLSEVVSAPQAADAPRPITAASTAP